MNDGSDKNGPSRADGLEQIRQSVANPQPVAPRRSPVVQSAPRVPGFVMREDGLYASPPNDDDPPYKICGPFEVVAEGRGVDGSHGWALLLRWHNRDEEEVEWLMPREMIAGDGTEVRKRFASGGLDVSGQEAHRRKIREYLSAVKVPARVRIVQQTGWHQPKDGGPVFVLPDRVIRADAGEDVRLDMDPLPSVYRSGGTLDGWRHEVARRCAGNTRLVFGVAAAFAVPLLPLVGDEGGGINLRGESSKGKTTIIDAAASVWGQASKTGPDAFVRPWRATSNGLEGVASAHNHALLPMDEMGQMEPRELGETLYMLANGAGKERARAGGGNRRAVTWLTLVLSSSEESARSIAQQAGRHIKAGQEVRLLDIPAVVPGGHGCFDDVHDEGDGASFAKALRRAVRVEYGTAAPAFLQWLVERLAAEPDFVREEITPRAERWVAEVVPAGADGQVVRAAGRLALVAAAGELATRAGITGWSAGEAERAVACVFRDWLREWGGIGSREDHNLRLGFRRWVLSHGAARFETVRERDESGDAGEQNAPKLPDREKTIYRAGWRWQEHDDSGEPFWVYGILPEVFADEVTTPLGMEKRDACARLWKAQMIRANKESGRTRWTIRPRQIPGHGRPRLIVTDSRMLEEGEVDEEAAG